MSYNNGLYLLTVQLLFSRLSYYKNQRDEKPTSKKGVWMNELFKGKKKKGRKKASVVLSTPITPPEPPSSPPPAAVDVADDDAATNTDDPVLGTWAFITT